MSTADICRQIERHSCCILGETYTFKVQPATVRADTPALPPDHTLLHIEVFGAHSGEHAVARMRIMAPTRELERISTVVVKALEQWLIASTVPAGRVH